MLPAHVIPTRAYHKREVPRQSWQREDKTRARDEPKCAARDNVSRYANDNVGHNNSPCIHGSDCDCEYTITIHATGPVHVLEDIMSDPKGTECQS